jgi:hypothetical protein
MLVPNKRKQPSLLLAGKAGAYPSEAPFKCSAFGHSSDLIHKHYTGLERFAKHKPSGLL